MRSLKILILLLSITAAIKTNGQVVQTMGYDDYYFRKQVNIGKGTISPTNPAAYLEVGKRSGSIKGFLPPRGNKDSVTIKYIGLLFDDSTTNTLVRWNGSDWENLGAGAADGNSYLVSGNYASNTLTLVRNGMTDITVTLPFSSKLNVTDTTGKWINSVYRRSDSVFYKKGSTETFAFLVSPDWAGADSQYVAGDGSYKDFDSAAVIAAKAAFSATAPLVYLNGNYSIPAATALVNGYLSSSNFSNFQTAYNRRILSVNVTGTTTKTVQVNLGDGTQLTSSWADLNGGTGGSSMAINGDTTASQILQTGTSGSDFTIDDDGAGTHTFNLPFASTTSIGKLDSADFRKFDSAYTVIKTGAVGADGNNYSTSLSFTNNLLTVNRNGLSAITAAWDSAKYHSMGFYDGRYQPVGSYLTSYTETDPNVATIIKNIPVSADATTNKYLNWNGSAYTRKQIAYSEISGTPTISNIYNADGHLSSNRTVYIDNRALNFTDSAEINYFDLRHDANGLFLDIESGKDDAYSGYTQKFDNIDMYVDNGVGGTWVDLTDSILTFGGNLPGAVLDVKDFDLIRFRLLGKGFVTSDAYGYLSSSDSVLLSSSTDRFLITGNTLGTYWGQFKVSYDAGMVVNYEGLNPYTPNKNELALSSFSTYNKVSYNGSDTAYVITDASADSAYARYSIKAYLQGGTSREFIVDPSFYQFKNLASSSDTTTYKPGGYDANGKLVRMNYWPGSGSGGGGSSVSFGSDGQLPYMNSGGTDYNYTNNLKYDATNKNLYVGDATVSPTGSLIKIAARDAVGGVEMMYGATAFGYMRVNTAVGFMELGSDYYPLRIYSAGSQVLTFSSGNVGVGTTPVTKLDVAGDISNTSSNRNYLLHASGSVSAPTYSFWNDDNNGWYSNAADQQSWVTAGTEQMRLDASGNLSLLVGALTLPEQSAPSTPASGFGSLYIKSDGLLYWKDDAGVEHAAGGSGGSSTLAGLTDVSFTSLATNDFLKYNGTNWINRTPANVRSDLGLASIATSGSAADLSTGTLPSGRIAGTATDGYVATLVSGVPTWQAAPSVTETDPLSIHLTGTSTLTGSSTIATGSNTLNVTGTSAANATLYISNSSAIGLQVDAIGSTSAAAKFSMSGSSSGSGSVAKAIEISSTNAGSSNGFGSSIDFLHATSTGSLSTANRLISKWSTATDASKTSQFDITGVNNGTAQTILTSKGTGQLQLPKYGVTTFTGTVVNYLAVDASGNVIETAGTGGGGDVTQTGAQALTNKDLTSGTNTFPTFNQNTTGSAASLTTTRTIWGQNFNGTANVSGDLATTGTRVTKGWFTDAEFTNMPTINGTSLSATVSTLTNKRITPRTGTTASSTTPTINTDNVDFYSITAQTVDITSMTTNLSGTPTAGQRLVIEITGTASRAITWGASFEAGAIALPTTTSGTSRLSCEFVWNTATSKWTIKSQW